MKLIAQLLSNAPAQVIDTKKYKLVPLLAQKSKGERAALIGLQPADHCMITVITDFDIGFISTNNEFVKELCRRWDEFPEELKK